MADSDQDALRSEVIRLRTLLMEVLLTLGDAESPDQRAELETVRKKILVEHHSWKPV